MKNVIMKVVMILFALQFVVNVGHTQVSLEIDHATYSQKCRNGCVDLNIQGGVGPYEVEYFQVWKPTTIGDPLYYQSISYVNGVDGSDGQEDICELLGGARGNYRVVVTDALCGQYIEDFRVRCECDEDLQCRILADITEPGCNGLGAYGGSIQTRIECSNGGFFQPTSIVWSDGVTNTNKRFDLDPGQYSVIMTDINGCKLEGDFTVSGERPDAYVDLINIQHVSVCLDNPPSGEQDCDGIIEINVPRGSTIRWNGPSGWSAPAGNATALYRLCEGMYTVTVIIDGCEIRRTFRIECCRGETAAENMSITPILTSLSNVASQDGSIILLIEGGAQSKIYKWTGPNGFTSSMSSIRNLVPGTYCVEVSDGCTRYEDCFTLVDCSSHSIDYNVEIGNACNILTSAGYIKISIDNPIEPIRIVWDDGTTSLERENLTAGEYCFTITDGSGCVEVDGCVNVGTSNDLVVATDAPCAITTSCNGVTSTVDYVIVPTIVSCSTIRWTCTATGNSQDISYPTERYINSSCNVMRRCIGGGEEVVAFGTREFGTYISGDYSCPYDYSCIGSICMIDGQAFIDPTAQSTCAFGVLACNWDCPRTCATDLYCPGEVYVGSFCDERASNCCMGFDSEEPSAFVKKSKPDNFRSISSDEVVFLESMVINRSYGNTSSKNRVPFFKQPDNIPIFKFTSDSYVGDVEVFPNPSSSSISIKIPVRLHSQELEFSIVNLLGETLKSRFYEKAPLLFDESLDELPNGTYFVVLNSISTGNTHAVKFVKQ